MVHKDGHCSLNAVEAVPLDQLDIEAVREGLSQAENTLANASGDQAKALGQIAVDVHKAMLYELQ